jgi:hypothetical protein
MQIKDVEDLYQPNQLHLKLIVKQHVQEKEHGLQTLLQQPLKQVLQMEPLKLIPYTATVLTGKLQELFVNLLLLTQLSLLVLLMLDPNARKECYQSKLKIKLTKEPSLPVP